MHCAHSLLLAGRVHVIASDAHDPRLRPVNLSRGLEAAAHLLGNPAAARSLVTTHPAAILEGRDLPPPHRPPVRRRPWWRLWDRVPGP